MKPKKISKEFRKNSYNHRLLKRKGDLVIYEQLNNEGNINSYEVHKIRIKGIRGFLLNSDKYKGYSHYEVLAGNEEFGIYGWSYKTLNYLYSQHPLLRD